MTIPVTHAVSFPLKQISIIGLGLIGSSWVKALRKSGLVEKVVGYDRNLDSMQQALQLDIIDDYCDSAAQAVVGSQLVILSVPILAGAGILKLIKSSLADALKVRLQQMLKLSMAVISLILFLVTQLRAVKKAV
jgi:prephenate dehydrogenase